MLPQCFLSVAHAAVIRTTLVRPYSQPCFWESFRAQLRRTQMGIPSDSSVIPQCFLYSSGLVLCCFSLLCSRELNVSCFLYVFLRARFILPFLALFPRAKCFVFLCVFLRDFFMLFFLALFPRAKCCFFISVFLRARCMLLVFALFPRAKCLVFPFRGARVVL